MDIDGLGTGAGAGGLFGAIATWLGIRGKLKDHDEKFKAMEDKMVFRDTCRATHNGVTQLLTEMNKKIDRILDHQNGGGS